MKKTLSYILPLLLWLEVSCTQTSVQQHMEPKEARAALLNHSLPLDIREKAVNALIEAKDWKALVETVPQIQGEEGLIITIIQAVAKIKNVNSLPDLLRIKKHYSTILVSGEFWVTLNDAITVLEAETKSTRTH